MGVLRALLTGRPDPVVSAALEPARTTFSEDAGTDIDSGVLYGTPTTLDAWIYGTWRITRREALSVPAVKRARDLIVGGIGQFPLRLYDPSNRVIDWSLLSQPESGIPASVTWGRVVEDLLLDERAWLRVDALAWHGRPAQVVRLDAESVAITPRTVSYGYGAATVWPEVAGLVRIDSPNPGLLSAGASAIRALSLLERVALNHASGVPPLDYFGPAEDVDPEQADVLAFLDAWAEARRTRSTAYVPAMYEYKTNGFNPEQLQMADARQHAVLEVARMTGIEAEALSVPVTSRDYFNAQDRRRERVEDVLGPYMTAIEQRLSMDDLTPHGYAVRFDTTAYLRLDDSEAATADVALVNANILTRDEARAKRGLEPLPAAVAAPAQPVEVTAA